MNDCWPPGKSNKLTNERKLFFKSIECLVIYCYFKHMCWTRITATKSGLACKCHILLSEGTE